MGKMLHTSVTLHVEPASDVAAAMVPVLPAAPSTVDVTVEQADETGATVAVVPTAFAPNIVQKQDATAVLASTEQDQEEQSESINILRNMWINMEKKKKKSWTPTLIQLSSWPLLLSTNAQHQADDASILTNVIGIAPTGSGKTLAYGIPMLIMATSNVSGGVCGVILVPTRELASQIERELKIMSTCLSYSGSTKQRQKQLKIVAVYGGVDRDDQIAWLCSGTKKKSMLVTATPGRLIDLLQEKRVKQALSNDNVRMVVLDEADRMATCKDMSKQVDEILSVIAPPGATTARTCLYSATYPRSVKKKWNDWVTKPRVCLKINTSAAAAPGGDGDVNESERTKRKRGGGSMELAKIAAHVSQTMQYCTDADDKTRHLITTLFKIRKDEADAKTRRKGLLIVFFNRVKTLQNVAKILVKEHPSMKCAVIHGKIDQDVREQRLSDFKSGKTTTLLATDIAARGIHVNNVQYVINHDFPETLDQYVHRCGRAGRTQDSKKVPIQAQVCSFYTTELAPIAKSVLTLLQASENPSTIIDPKLVELAETSTPAVIVAKKKKRKPDGDATTVEAKKKKKKATAK